MQRTNFGAMACSIARTVDIAGEPWSPLILRDVYVGITRFYDIQQSLGVSSKVLTERLRWLVQHSMLERHRYSERPPRDEYLLTEKGLEFCEVLLAISAWGDKWAAGPDGAPALFHHRSCGRRTHAEVHCAACGQRLRAADVEVSPGPGARHRDATTR